MQNGSKGHGMFWPKSTDYFSSNVIVKNPSDKPNHIHKKYTRD